MERENRNDQQILAEKRKWPSLRWRITGTALTSLPTMTGGMIWTADRIQDGDEKAAIAVGISTLVGSIGLAHAIISWVIKDLRENPSGAGTF